MIFKFKQICIFILLLFCKLLFSQDRPIEDYFIPKKVNVTNAYNIGKPDVSIPIFNIGTNEINLSSAINYSNNFVIGEPSLVGTNWDVNLLGKIIIKHSEQFFDPIVGKSTNGFYTETKNDCFTSDKTLTLSKKQALENPEKYVETYFPNEFFFNFLGYSGSFVYDNAGNFLVRSNNGDFKVLYNGFKCYNVYSPINSNFLPEIIMQDDKGNKFYFGGDYNSIDINYSKNKYQYSNISDSGSGVYSINYTVYRNINYINSLSLRKVELNNGRIVEAFYRRGNRTILDAFTNGGYYFGDNYSFVFPSKESLFNNNLFVGKDKINNYNSYNFWNTSTSSGFSDNKVDTFYKQSILDSIKITDYGTVRFSYEQINNELTKPFLKKIEIKNNHKTVKNINFDYQTIDERVFLKSITSNESKYSFEYYNFSKNQNITASVGGLLKKIIYPTKGYDILYYEQNDVSKVTGIDDSYNYFINNVPDKIVPGYRLKSIKSFEGFSTNFIEKKYFYKNDGGMSSGITNSKQASSMGSTSDPLAMFSSYGGYYTSLYDSNVKYSKVIEEIKDKGRTEYYFTDEVSNPDSLVINKYGIQSITSITKGIYINKGNERGKIFKINKLDSNNKLVYQEVREYKNFSNNLNTLKEISNTCIDCKISDDRFYIRAFKDLNHDKVPYTYFGFYGIQTYLPYLPKKILKKQLISGSNYIETITSLKYNERYLYWHPNPIEVKTEEMGLTNVKKFFYPGDILFKNSNCVLGNCPTDSDLLGEKFSIYRKMIDNNINLPIVLVNENNLKKTILEEKVYKKDNSSSDLIKLDKERLSDTNNNLSNNNFNQVEMINKQSFELYDSKGNLIQFRKENGIPETIIWGYNQTLPIAKIVGATYAEVMQVFSLSTTDALSYLSLDIVRKSDLDIDDTSEQNLLSALENFRNNTAFKDFQITTYTYNPLIGITSMASPNGMKQYFKYNPNNDLEKIIDSSGNILKEYKYRYMENPNYPQIFYNIEQSKTFKRNNCGQFSDGGLFNYIVTADSYNSTISQTDADQKAINDINNNGQRLANESASCFSSNCSYSLMGANISEWVIYEKDWGKYHYRVKIYPKDMPNRNWTEYSNIGRLDTCKPSRQQELTFSELPGGPFGDTPANRTWQVRITEDGFVSIKLLSGTINYGYYDYFTIDFDYSKI